MYTYSKFEHNYTKSVYNYIEPISEDYRVFVNGGEIPVYTCRISQYPLNRVWTGFQRPIEQTELASYVNIVSDEEIKLEVIVNRKYEKILIKPYSKNVSYTDENGKISFSLKENGQFVLECDSYHHCLYIFNSKPIAAPKESDVTYFFGAGIHYPGKITLKSNESVYVDKDALVFGCLFAENAENIHIFGNGILDDSNEERFCIHCYEDYANGNMKFYECNNIKIEGVGMKNSAIWCLNLFACRNVTADNIKIFGQWRYNTDGIDIVNCRDIFIKNSFIHSFDDTITIKGIDRYAHLDNVNIHTDNCVLWCDWGKCCEVGIETCCRAYDNIGFKNCDVLRGGGIALDISNGDYAEISNVVFENINVEYNSFDTDSQYQETDEMKYNKENTQAIPILININNGLYRTSETRKLWGMPEAPDVDTSDFEARGVHDVTYKNINVYYDDKLWLKDNKPYIAVHFISQAENIKYRGISISDISVNGKKLDVSDLFLDDSGAEDFTFK